MGTRILIRGVVISAVLFLLLAGVTSQVSGAIVVDNDVIIEWQENNSHSFTSPVVGAPRLVSDWRSIRILISLLSERSLNGTSELELSFYPPDLCSEGLRGCPTRVTLPFTSVPAAGFDVASFLAGMDDAAIEAFLDRLPTPGILTVRARINVSTRFPDDPGVLPLRKIAVSGEGHQIIVDRIGDGDGVAGGAADLPTRSIELARALNQIESAALPKRAVDLDVAAPAGAGIAVGVTHAFDFPEGAGDRPVHGATLTLRLSSDDPGSPNGVLLLDAGVRNVARQRRRVSLTPLRQLDAAPVVGQPDAADFTIDLSKVPISTLSSGDLTPSRLVRLLRELVDGRLDVIVSGRSTRRLLGVANPVERSPRGSVEPEQLTRRRSRSAAAPLPRRRCRRQSR